MTAGLAHYMENVLNLADKKAGWRYYDEQFRHLIASGMAACGGGGGGGGAINTPRAVHESSPGVPKHE